MKRRKRYLPTKWIYLLAIITICMGIGYAALGTNLEIVGTSDVDSAIWEVYFDNIQVNIGSVTPTIEPTITDDTTVSFSVTLENPGDYFEFFVDVLNDGTLDAKIDSIQINPVLTSIQQNYFNYIVTYADGLPIEIGDALEAGQTEKILIRFEYLTQTDISLYPTDDITFDFGVGISYIQGNGNKKIFSVSSTALTTGQLIPTGVQTFDNYQDAITSFGVPFFTKHKIVNNIVSSSVVGFVLNSKSYYMKASSDGRFFEDNKKTLLKAFGDANCVVSSSGCTCSNGDFTSNARIDGFIIFGNGLRYCYGDENVEYACLIIPDN